MSDPLVGKYFIAWHGRSRHDLGFPVIQSYGLVSGKVRDGLYSVEVYELGSPEVRSDTMTRQRLAGCRLFDEWRRMKTWISDVYMPCIRVEVFGGAGGGGENTASIPGRIDPTTSRGADGSTR